MTEFKYGKSYARKQFDGHGTRFRTDGTTLQIEVFFPLVVKEICTDDLAYVLRDKAWALIDSTTSIRDLVFADEPDEQYLVVSGWTTALTDHERELASVLTFH